MSAPDFLREAPSVALGHPLSSIWFHPRETVRVLASSRPGYLFVPLVCAYGAVNSLNKVVTRGVTSPDPNAYQVVGLNLLFGALFGYCLLHTMARLLAWAGRLLGGRATPQVVRTALAWACVPFLPLLVAVVLLVLFGPREILVRPEGSGLTAVTGSAWVLAYMVSWAILGGWLCVIGVVGLSEVHAFSNARSMASWLIAVGALIAVVLLVLLVIRAAVGI